MSKDFRGRAAYLTLENSGIMAFVNHEGNLTEMATLETIAFADNFTLIPCGCPNPNCAMDAEVNAFNPQWESPENTEPVDMMKLLKAVFGDEQEESESPIPEPESKTLH